MDRTDAGKNYAVPKDNPFVSRKGALPEIWAYGLRQPWKISFDRPPARCGSARSARICGRACIASRRAATTAGASRKARTPSGPDRKKGADPILPPVVEHPHTEFRSLTGGYVYRGTRLKDLVGSYIYGDFDTGRVWDLRVRGKKSKRRSWPRQLCGSSASARITPASSICVDFAGGQLHRLVPTPAQPMLRRFPAS